MIRSYRNRYQRDNEYWNHAPRWSNMIQYHQFHPIFPNLVVRWFNMIRFKPSLSNIPGSYSASMVQNDHIPRRLLKYCLFKTYITFTFAQSSVIKMQALRWSTMIVIYQIHRNLSPRWSQMIESLHIQIDLQFRNLSLRWSFWISPKFNQNPSKLTELNIILPLSDVRWTEC